MKKHIGEADISAYRSYLVSGEKSRATIEKYMRDIRNFYAFAAGRAMTKELAIAYKTYLRAKYMAASVNSMLAAVNGFLLFTGFADCRVKLVRTQKKTFCEKDRELTKEEYLRLVRAAEEHGSRRMGLILKTLCGTGMRVSELPYITVQAVHAGQAEVSLKGKTRTIFITGSLKKQLIRYIREKGVASGPVFVTGGGKPVNRSNIWKAMKRLCAYAKVNPRKGFPHNLRHLFARTFYRIKRDIAKLADILGHRSIETTRIYLLEAGAEHARIVERMGLVV